MINDHISTSINTIARRCPFCGAKPWQQCFNPESSYQRPLRYTHAERNR